MSMVMKRSWWVMLAALNAACSGGEGGGAESDQAVPDITGKVLAEVSLSETHRVRFIELDGGRIAVSEDGELGEVGEQVDQSELSGRSFSQQFAVLARKAHLNEQAPLALLEAEARVRALPGQGLEALREPPLAADPSALDEAVPRVERGANLESGKLQQGLDYAADAQWWKDNFCSADFVDGHWCPTNVTSAHTSSLKAMYFEPVCLAASQTAKAHFWVEYYNGSSWVRDFAITLRPRHWQRFVDEGVITRRAGCDGLDPDPHVHFVRRMRKAPAALSYLNTSPNDRSRELDNDHQGSANDGENWYFTSAKPDNGTVVSRLWKIPLGMDVGTDSPPLRVGNPWNKRNPDGKRYDHFGDPVWVGSRNVLAVPLEMTDRVTGSERGRGAIGFFNANLEPYGYATLPTGAPAASDETSGCAWVAWNPQENLLYTSTGNNWLNKWRLVSLFPPQLAYVEQVRLLDTNGIETGLPYLSGGEFSSSGKLYLVQNDGNTGLAVVDPYTGRVHMKKSFVRGDANENEGITIWDLDADTRDSRIHGQIHVSFIQNEFFSNDDFFFQHFGASPVGNL